MPDTKLAQVMRDKGVTVKGLAELSGVKWRTIEGYRQGRYSLNKAQYWIVKAIAAVLNVEMDEIID